MLRYISSHEQKVSQLSDQAVLNAQLLHLLLLPKPAREAMRLQPILHFTQIIFQFDRCCINYYKFERQAAVEQDFLHATVCTP